MGSGYESRTRNHAGTVPVRRVAEISARSPSDQRLPLASIIQRAATDRHALTHADVVQLQRTIGNAALGRVMRTAARGENGAEAPSKLKSQPAPAPNRTGLPDRLKTGVENLSGLAMDDVRVHYNSPRPAQVQAHAYTQGTDIHVAPAQEKHLPHEAWHAVQQKQGRVAPTLQLKGAAINDDSALEREADEMGARAAGSTPAPEERDERVAQRTSAQPSSGVMQRQVAHDAPRYTPKDGRAGSVEVDNIRGKPYGPSANAPSVDDVFGWPELWAEGHTLASTNPNSSHYNAVRMHLWNGRLGGPGDQKLNLAPGPAQVNSSMSAGPETASKDAVSAGRTIWLKTEVWYLKSSGLALDFESVIPNRMKMEWGYMELGGRGTPQPPHWDMSSIPQPVDAMTQIQQDEYKGLTDSDTADLDTLLSGASVQTQAQAYTLVTDALKKYMLLKYPAVFASMAEAERTAALGALSAVEIIALAKLEGITDTRGLYNEMLSYLLGDQTKLVAVYDTLSGIEKTSVVRYAGWELLRALGAAAEPLAKSNWEVFKLYPDAARYDLLDSMTKEEISTLTGASIRYELFVAWAKSRGHQDAEAISDYVCPRLSDSMNGNFNTALDLLRSQERYAQQTRERLARLEEESKTPSSLTGGTVTAKPIRARTQVQRTNISKEPVKKRGPSSLSVKTVKFKNTAAITAKKKKKKTTNNSS